MSDDEEIIDPFDNAELITKQTKKALRMKREGYDFVEIAQALTKLSGGVEVTPALARRRVRQHWDKVKGEALDEHLQYELARLDDLLKRYYRMLGQIEDDLAETDTIVKLGAQILKVSERRSKLLGLDAAQKVDATVTETTQQDLELQEMIREAEAANAVKAQNIKKRARR